MKPDAAIRRARERAGLSQQELARRAGTSQATISAYENAAKEPSLRTFDRLLAAAGARLVMKPGAPGQLRDPDEAARRFAEVLALAEALPARRPGELRYPRLPATR